MTEFRPVPTEDFDGEPLSIEDQQQQQQQEQHGKGGATSDGRRWMCCCLIAVLTVIGLGVTAVVIFALPTTSHNSSSNNNNNMPEIRSDGQSYPRKSIQEVMDTGLPYLIYGTAWKEEMTHTYVEAAVQNGFTFIDTANQPKHYNETGAGVGWTNAATTLGLQRDQLYIQTKFSPLSGQDPNNVPYNSSAPIATQVSESAASSLRHLQTDYLDAVILHSPYHNIADTLEAWHAMETLVDQRTVKRLGISNCYTLATLEQLYDGARIKPSILQNHFRVRDFDPTLLQFTRDHDMQYQGFWTLTSNKQLLRQSEIVNMANEAGGLTPQAYMYAFLLAVGITPLDGTKNHQIEDANLIRDLQDPNSALNIFQTDEEIQQMANALGLSLP